VIIFEGRLLARTGAILSLGNYWKERIQGGTQIETKRHGQRGIVVVCTSGWSGRQGAGVNRKGRVRS